MLAPSRKAFFGRPGVLPVSPGAEAESRALVAIGALGVTLRLGCRTPGRERRAVGDLRSAAWSPHVWDTRLHEGSDGRRETSGRRLVRGRETRAQRESDARAAGAILCGIGRPAHGAPVSANSGTSPSIGLAASSSPSCVCVAAGERRGGLACPLRDAELDAGEGDGAVALLHLVGGVGGAVPGGVELHLEDFGFEIPGGNGPVGE